MNVDLCNFPIKNKTVAVALSGGGDSMALLHYMLSQAKIYSFSVIAINVEHGIRGQESINDTLFVKDYCDKRGVTLIRYDVDCVKKAKEERLLQKSAERTANQIERILKGRV